MANQATIERLAEWLKDKDDIAVLGHVNPDGDAAGSALAVTLALRALGKRAVACLPGGVPRLYGMLPGAAEARDPGQALPFAPKTALAVDVSEAARLGEAGLKLFEGCPNQAALDHHATNPGFGQLYALDGEAAATGELALRLIEALGVALDRDMADCLFVAISTDSGQFSYSLTRPETFRAAAKCAAAGADIPGLTQTLYHTRSLGRTKLLGLVLAGLEISPDGRMAWARLTEAMLAQAGALREDNEGIVNYLRDIDGVVFAALAEQAGEKTKVSLRSNAPLDVAANVAVPLGGGGHSRAAGCTLDMPMEPALEKVLATARAALERAGVAKP